LNQRVINTASSRGVSLRLLALIGIALLGCGVALADDTVPPVSPLESGQVPPAQSGRITIIEENGNLMPQPTDRWYTNGLALLYLSPPMSAGSFDAFIPSALLDPAPVYARRFELLFGQNIFTPANIKISPPDPADRPYAGWLYTGAGLYQQHANHSLDHFELEVGVVGPASLAAQVQEGFHSLLTALGKPQIVPAGWAYQLNNEPGVVLSYEHKWRFDIPIGGGLSVDAIPEVGATVGNIYTYGEVSTLLRLGQNLNADYGPARVRPALSGGSWFDPAQLNGPFGWYLFVGSQVRGVARNIFLDGNSFVPSPWVEKYPFVADLSGGVSLFWSDLSKVDFVVTWRSKEFVGQSAPDRYGGINISFRLP
jgi:hypothetical protein